MAFYHIGNTAPARLLPRKIHSAITTTVSHTRQLVRFMSTAGVQERQEGIPMTSADAADQPAQRSVEGMAEGGKYARYALSQRRAVRRVNDRFLSSSLLKDVCASKPAAHGVNFVDYGAADCLNSIEMYATISTLAKSHSRQLQISAVDLPTNDWSTARRYCEDYGYHVTDGLVSKTQGDDKAMIDAPVTIAQVGKSFYDQVMPLGCVDIGVSVMAVHWLSAEALAQHNLSIENSIMAVAGRASEEEMQRFRGASMQDGERFLLARAQELRVGGRLFICIPNVGILDNLLSEIEEVLARYCKASGEDTLKRWRAMYIPAYIRSEEDWQALFLRDTVKQSGISLISMETEILENPYYEQAFLTEISAGKESSSRPPAEIFAHDYMQSAMAPLGRLFQRLFEQDEIERFQQELCARIAEKPAHYRNDYPIMLLEIEKQS